MKISLLFGSLALPLTIGLFSEAWFQASAGELPSAPEYKVLAPLRHGNLTVFPVVAGVSHETGEFLTLDEGIKSGEVGLRSTAMYAGCCGDRHGPVSSPLLLCMTGRRSISWY